MDFTVLFGTDFGFVFILSFHYCCARLFRWKRCEISISTKWWDFGMLLSIMHRLRRPPNILAWNVTSRCPKKLHWLVLIKWPREMCDHRNLQEDVFCCCCCFLCFRSQWGLHICLRMTLIWILLAVTFHGSYQILRFRHIGFMPNTFVCWISRLK